MYIVGKLFRFFKNKFLNILVWRFLNALEGLKSSGRPVGTISTNFRQIPSGGFRAMTQKPKMLTTKKATTIYM